MPETNGISLKGKHAAIMIYPVNKRIGIDIFNKKGRIDRLDLTREQWLELSSMVLSQCFKPEGATPAVVEIKTANDVIGKHDRS